MRILRTAALAAVVAVAAGSTAIQAAPSVVAIDPLAGNTTTTHAGMTPDGKFVVGVSGGGTAAGFVWDAVNGTQSIGDGLGNNATEARGVGYRTVNGQQQLVIWSKSAGWPATYIYDVAGSTKTFSERKLYTTNGTGLTGLNALAGSSTDVFYTASSDGNTKKNLGKGSGSPSNIVFSQFVTAGPRADINMPSSNGRAAARSRDAANVYRNAYYDYNPVGAPTETIYNGLDGTPAGEAWSISANGDRLGGMSPVPLDLLNPRSGNWPYIYDVSLNRIVELPTFANTAGSVTNGLPYGMSADGKYAVGMNYRGAERAVLWNISDPDPTKWTITDLTEWATAQGIMGSFTAFSRAHAVGLNANGQLVVSGRGSTAAGERAFVLTFPEPATLTLLALGGLVLRRRKA